MVKPRWAASASLVLLLATPALGAPICSSLKGETVHCDAPNAMPVGWSPSAAVLAAAQSRRPPEPSRTELISLAWCLVLFLALIGLLPKFDGSQSSDWDGHDKET